MSVIRMQLIEDDNLSRAWARAFVTLMQPGVDEIVPLQVTIRDFGGEDALEAPSIRRALDDELKSQDMFSCETVAGTIFPQSMWNPAVPRERLFGRYLAALPRLKKFKQNIYGLYFERLIAHGPKKFNQLDFMLTSRLGDGSRKGNKRRSVLQASIMEPDRDLTNQPLRGFPCLQQVSFAPFGQGELAVNGFYGTQFIFQKAYGNYLGLYRLGQFVAHELGLKLTQISCFTGIAQLGTGKSAVKDLGRKIGTILDREASRDEE
jgi:hypothetical protein